MTTLQDKAKAIIEAREAYKAAGLKRDWRNYIAEARVWGYDIAKAYLELVGEIEDGFGERHEAHRYRKIHPAVEQMGGWANFSHWVLKHSANYFETCAKLEAQLKVAVDGLEFYANNKTWKFASYNSEVRETVVPTDLSNDNLMFSRGGKRARADLARIEQMGKGE